MKLKFKYSSLLYVAVFNIIFFYEPFLYSINIIQNAGSLNPIFAPVLGIILAIYVSNKNIGKAIYYLFYLVIIALLCSVLNVRITVELFRDLNYLLILFLLIGLWTELIKEKPQLFQKNIKSFIYCFIFLQLTVPFVFFGVIYQDNRLPLNNLSDTNSALILCFIIYSYLFLNFDKKKIIWALGFFLVVLSGSRAAFIFYLIGGIFFKEKLFPVKRHRKYLAVTILVIISFLFISVDVFDKLRVISLEDVNKGQGSVYSRLNWFYIMYDIIRSNWIAGFGGGFAEQAVGKIVHNDILRFWIDYSIFFPMVFYSYFYNNLFDISSINYIKKYLHLYYKEVIFLSLSLLIMSLYNGFQDLPLIISFSLFFSVMCYSIRKKTKINKVGLYKC